MGTVKSVKRLAGIAGQYGMRATVAYDGEPDSVVTFYGSTYGGPVVMESETGAQVFVSADVLDRIGHTLTEEWVRAFFE